MDVVLDLRLITRVGLAYSFSAVYPQVFFLLMPHLGGSLTHVLQWHCLRFVNVSLYPCCLSSEAIEAEFAQVLTSLLSDADQRR